MHCVLQAKCPRLRTSSIGPQRVRGLHAVVNHMRFVGRDGQRFGSQTIIRKRR